MLSKALRYIILAIAIFLVSFAYTQPVIVQSLGNNPLYLNGSSPLKNTWYEQNTLRGYFGSSSGNLFDVDIGHNGITGDLHLTTMGIPRLTVASTGNIGIGSTFPSLALTIDSGNVQLLDSDKGIILNAVDRPLITRHLDPFGSGTYAGIGRWGLFMEPNRLVFGIPDLNLKGFEFARFNPESSKEAILTINREGDVLRDATSTVDLLVHAMGNVKADGTIFSGTGNFTITKPGLGQWSITLTGESYDPADFVVIVTVSEISIAPSFAATYQQTNPDRIGVEIRTSNGSFIDQGFHFVVYKL